MNFFKSVFSDDQDPLDSPTADGSPSNLQSDESNSGSPSNPNPDPDMTTITNAWTFGSSLFKTLASKSESVIETYRRDLEEFGSGLKKETDTIREVTSRAVKDLPSRLATGAAVAQEKLESVGEAIDNIGMTMTEIIAQGKDSILADDSDSESNETKHIGGSSSQLSLNSYAKPYNRFDAQIRAIQCDAKTYCEEPEDVEEYNEWKSGFVLDEKRDEIEDLMEENGAVEGSYNEIVSVKIDHETFWSRYFYKVYRVKKAEETRAKLVKRAISGGEEEELSWEVEDEPKTEIEEKDVSANSVDKSEVELERKNSKGEDFDTVDVSESKVAAKIGDGKGTSEESMMEPGLSSNKLGLKSDGKVASEGKADGGSRKDSDVSVVSSQPSFHEEEDIEWDEIEDIGSNDGIKATANKTDLSKKLSASEEEEDLIWDIEDDDEPAKA